MNITQHIKDNYSVYQLDGSLDMYTSLDLKKKIDDEGEKQGRVIILNLSGITYIDSSGIGSLIKMLNELQEKQQTLMLTEPKPMIEKIFKVAGLTNFFPTINESEMKERYPLD